MTLAAEYYVAHDWRGETAYCVEPDRRVWLSCIYWGGPIGNVSYIHGVWEFADGRREPLSAEARASILQRVIEHARRPEGITLEVEGE